jgi:hypothetical protein
MMKKTPSSAKLSGSQSSLKKALTGAEMGDKLKIKSKATVAAAAGPNHARDLVDEYQKVAADLTAQVFFSYRFL